MRDAAGTPPSPRDKMTATTVGQKIYVFGGFGPKISAANDDDVRVNIGRQFLH